MYGLVVAMIRVFSAKPPVNSRRTGQPAALEDTQRKQIIFNLSNKISTRLQEGGNDAVTELGQILSEKEDFEKKTNESAMNPLLLSAYTQSEEELAHLTKRREQLQNWRDAMGDVSGGTLTGEIDVDAVLQYRDMMFHQIFQNKADDYALSDTLDQMDEAFVKGVIDHDRYVKDVRSLSRKQFYPRAMWKKLEGDVERSGDSQNMLKRSSSARRQPFFL